MTARDRRAVRLGLALLSIAFLLLRGVPWTAHRFADLRSTALERTATLARAEVVLADRMVVRDSFEHVVAGIMGLAPHLLEGRSPADAQASLSALVSLAASRHAVRVLRVDPLASSDSASAVFDRVAVHVEVESDVGGMMRLVRALETAEPLLSITSLAISAPNPAPPPNQAEALRGELTVTGYYLPKGAR